MMLCSMVRDGSAGESSMARGRETGATAGEGEIVAAALAIAAEQGWDHVRLHAVAERAGLSLAELGGRYRDVDAIANAWFRAARQAMLAAPAGELEGLPVDERIALVLDRWLDHLAPHRGVAGEILRLKLHPSHPHHWVPLVFDLSRLVHDVLDAGRVEGAGRRRQAQEIGLTLIVLATLGDWLRDGSPGQQRTKERLKRRLAVAGRLARLVR
jgi:AcrR family transcriptional regulator